MRIKVLTPVADNLSDIEKDMEQYLRPFLRENTELVFETLKYGFPSVENAVSDTLNGAQTVINLVDSDTAHLDGMFVNCFDDPGVYPCRELGKIPVIGPYAAALSSAILTGERIGIITTDEAGILSEERKLRETGLQNRVVAIQAVDLNVEDIKTLPEKVLEKLEEVCIQMVQVNRVNAICLGCTAMFYVTEELKKRLREKGIKISIIEPLLNGMLMLEMILTQGLTNYIPACVDLSKLVWMQK